jgi:ribosomal-protein-alanine N-acetyltransferase
MTLVTPTAARASDLAAIDAVCFTDPWRETAFREALAGEGYTFLAWEDNGTLIGYAGMLTVLDTADITNVAILPEYRRRGLAKDLFAALTDAARSKGVTRLQLEVRESNTAARALYESLGFAVDGKRKHYYKKPDEDAILMSLTL